MHVITSLGEELEEKKHIVDGNGVPEHTLPGWVQQQFSLLWVPGHNGFEKAGDLK